MRSIRQNNAHSALIQGPRRSRPLHQLGGAEADLQALVVLGDPRFHLATNLLVDPTVEKRNGRRAPATTASTTVHLKPTQQQLIARARISTTLRG